MTMDAKAIFSAADAALASLTDLRTELSAAIGKPLPPVEHLKSFIDHLDDVQARIETALAGVGVHEEALRDLERPLVVRDDEKGLAARDTRLRQFATHRERIGILLEEAAKVAAAGRKTAADAKARAYAIEKRREFETLFDVIRNVDELETRLLAMLEARREADAIWHALSRERAAYPDVKEFELHWDPELDAPTQMIERLAVRFTSLRSKRPGEA